MKKLGIDVPSERTCHRWLAKEKAAFDLPPEKDGQDGYTPEAPDWLNSAIQHLCKPDPQDSHGRNAIKRVFLCHCVLNENIKY